jgi:hypothetical protein
MMMSIGTAILAIFIHGWVILMIALLIDNEKERRFNERMRRKMIKRDFEKKIHNYEVYGNIDGREIIYIKEDKTNE